MTEKEKQVEEIAKLIGGPDCLERGSCCECNAYKRGSCELFIGAIEIYNAGYRKQSTDKEGKKMNAIEIPISEMAKTMYRGVFCHPLCENCERKKMCQQYRFSKRLYSAGYCKKSEVAENIIAMLKAAKPIVKTYFEAYDELIENIAAEYGVEAEE